MLYKSISKLIKYGLKNNLLSERDIIYTRNQVLELFKVQDFTDEVLDEKPLLLENILSDLLNEAVNRGLITDDITSRDLFDNKLMGCLLPRPSVVEATFFEQYKKSPAKATDYYYQFCKDSDYIRTYRISKDQKWIHNSPFGALDITINLSKPEKDPKAIAATKNVKQSGYPQCLLCRENEGYAGHLTHPARENHRIIFITMNNSSWGFQYSPYVYYNEHCIVFYEKHVPMLIDKSTFVKLMDFVDIFPHYFLGSNADLPIVGGSILSHDHFQGGRYTFAMEKAPIEIPLRITAFPDITVGIVDWPMSVLRLQSNNRERLIELCEYVLSAWRGYTDETCDILSHTKNEPHNTITPIARKKGDLYEFDLVLRNNRTSAEHPLGIFHPHAELHHIKKENIGLIEVMGLAVLPARLKNEMEEVANCIIDRQRVENIPTIAKHSNWVNMILESHTTITSENVMDILNFEIGKVFQKVLEDAGVYKCTKTGRAGFCRFIDFINSTR